jgi:hypothetical protein
MRAALVWQLTATQFQWSTMRNLAAMNPDPQHAWRITLPRPPSRSRMESTAVGEALYPQIEALESRGLSRTAARPRNSAPRDKLEVSNGINRGDRVILPHPLISRMAARTETSECSGQLAPDLSNGILLQFTTVNTECDVKVIKSPDASVLGNGQFFGKSTATPDR